MADKKPFEIARETLKQLTARKLVPTPANYLSIYNEIAGIPHVPHFPADILRDISQSLPTKTPGQQKQKGLLDYSIDRLSWDGVKSALVAYGGSVPVNGTDSASTGHVAVLSADTSAATVSPAALTSEFFGQIARLIEYAQPALGNDDPRFNEQTDTLMKALRQPATDASTAKQMLVNYSHRLSFAAEDQAEIRSTLLKLLHLVFENIGELSLEEHWLKGQMDALMQASTPPLTQAWCVAWVMWCSTTVFRSPRCCASRSSARILSWSFSSITVVTRPVFSSTVRLSFHSFTQRRADRGRLHHFDTVRRNVAGVKEHVR